MCHFVKRSRFAILHVCAFATKILLTNDDYIAFVCVEYCIVSLIFLFQYTGLGRGFWHAVGEVASANAAMDFLSATRSDPVYHFDSERVEGATQMLREFWGQTVLLTRTKEYQGARRSLGQLFHSLQVG